MTTERQYTAEAIAEQLRALSKGVKRLKRLAILLGCGLWWAAWTYLIFHFIVYPEVIHHKLIVSIILSILIGALCVAVMYAFLCMLIDTVHDFKRWFIKWFIKID